MNLSFFIILFSPFAINYIIAYHDKRSKVYFLILALLLSQEKICYLSCFGISKGTSQNFQNTPKGGPTIVVLFSSGFHTMKQLILQRFEITLNYFGIVQSNRLFFYFLQTVGKLKTQNIVCHWFALARLNSKKYCKLAQQIRVFCIKVYPI